MTAWCQRCKRNVETRLYGFVGGGKAQAQPYCAICASPELEHPRAIDPPKPRPDPAPVTARRVPAGDVVRVEWRRRVGRIRGWRSPRSC